MIISVYLKNFKPFKEQLLAFRPLTLLTGLNSTGKSSALQALLLLRQSYQRRLLPNIGLALNGDLVCIGTAQDAFCETAEEDYIKFDLTCREDKNWSWQFKYNQEKTDESVLNIISEPEISSTVYQLNLFTQKFHYLHAERLGPRPYNEMSDYQVARLQQVGMRGEYTVHFLAINEDKQIPVNKLSHSESKSLNLRDQVEAWMREISPGTRIKTILNSNMDLMSMQYFYGDSNLYRATNVGFGISYILPIIVVVLASEPGTLILIENPEAHLHPRGQAKMGELFALAASCGIQVVIETHSDHVLNGIRLAVHNGKLNPKDLQLHYFQRQEKEGQIFTEVVSPHIDKNGRIDRWPDGFFDQWDKNLEALLEPAGE